MDTCDASIVKIENRILLLRGTRVIVDSDLAELYGVTTRRLNEQFKRNQDRFPADFAFRLTAEEKSEVVANCDHLSKLKFSKTLPLAFTEHGAIQAANVLASPLAIEMGIHVVRIFVRLLELAVSNKEIALRLDDLEHKLEWSRLKQASFENYVQVQLKHVLAMLRELMAVPEAPPRRPIGFVIPEE